MEKNINNLEKVNKAIDYILENNMFFKNFEFREGQKETVIQICQAYLDGKVDTVILDAPVGSGKSYIALFSSLVLTHFKASGYILTSDLSLQEQYENDLKKLNFEARMVKGQNNYKCILNDQTFPYGDCQVRKINPKKLKCYKECEYLIKRDLASESKIAVLGYAYWLIHRNIVAKKNDLHPFTKRDFIFFDESHNVNKIVQNQLSPKINKEIYQEFEVVQRFLLKNNFIFSSVVNITALKKFLQRLSSQQLSKHDIYEIIDNIVIMFTTMGKFLELVQEKSQTLFPITSEFVSNKIIPQAWTSNIRRLQTIKDIADKMVSFSEMIKLDGVENVVLKNEEDDIIFNFLNESFLIKKHLINESGFKIYMSATIGDPQQYMKNVGIQNAKYINLKSTFDFKKSPIYFLKKNPLNYKNKEEVLPKIISFADLILSSIEKNNKGIVHTGSYNFSEEFLRLSKHKERIITYSDSSEKAFALERFINSKNGILVGSTLLEGLDLKNDLSRFQIFLKVPYSSLKDPLIKAKLNKSQDWYGFDTTIKVLQGIGRSVRSENDWARTYLLDSNFLKLLTKQDLPEHITERFRDLNSLLKMIINKRKKGKN